MYMIDWITICITLVMFFGGICICERLDSLIKDAGILSDAIYSLEDKVRELRARKKRARKLRASRKVEK